MILSKDFYQKDTISVAKSLLGKELVRILIDDTKMSGIICEVEAYLGIKDKACHTYNNKRTQRTYPMWLDGGHSYVYILFMVCIIVLM